MLKLKVGKTYLNGLRQEVTIVSFHRGMAFPFNGNNNRTYEITGRWNYETNRQDLIKEITMTAPKKIKTVKEPEVIVAGFIPTKLSYKEHHLSISDWDSCGKITDTEFEFIFPCGETKRGYIEDFKTIHEVLGKFLAKLKEIKAI